MSYDFSQFHIRLGDVDYPAKHNNAMDALANLGNDIITYKGQVLVIRDEAEQEKLLAKQYANHPEDIKIPGTNDYSAYHYKQKARAITDGDAYTSQFITGVTAAIASQTGVIKNAHTYMKLSEQIRKMEQ